MLEFRFFFSFLEKKEEVCTFKRWLEEEEVSLEIASRWKSRGTSF